MIICRIINYTSTNDIDNIKTKKKSFFFILKVIKVVIFNWKGKWYELLVWSWWYDTYDHVNIIRRILLFAGTLESEKPRYFLFFKPPKFKSIIGYF
jgi:hypothetical protein